MALKVEAERKQEEARQVEAKRKADEEAERKAKAEAARQAALKVEAERKQEEAELEAKTNTPDWLTLTTPFPLELRRIPWGEFLMGALIMINRLIVMKSPNTAALFPSFIWPRRR